MTSAPSIVIDTVAFFDDLAAAMAADPERYERLGDIDLDLAIVMRRPDGNHFRVRLAFHGIDRVLPGTSTVLPEGGRINLTLRRVTVPEPQAACDYGA